MREGDVRGTLLGETQNFSLVADVLNFTSELIPLKRREQPSSDTPSPRREGGRELGHAFGPAKCLILSLSQSISPRPKSAAMRRCGTMSGVMPLTVRYWVQ